MAKLESVNLGVDGETFEMEKEVEQESVDGETDLVVIETDGAIQDDHEGPPIDRGWAWVVLAGSILRFISQ
jgi:hypothetical protein